MANSPNEPATDPYVLGVNADELARLRLQHRLWSDAAHTLWRRAGVQPGWRVLDVGSGPGFAALDLAELVAGARAEAGGGAEGGVVAVDESGPFLEHLGGRARAAGIANLACIRADATRLTGVAGIDAGSFDGAYSRWVMCFVNDPAAVVRGVHAALKPGGRWMIQDYFNYEAMTTAPRSAAFARTVAATGKAWRQRGGDPDIVGRLTTMLESMGFTVDHLGVHQRVTRPGDPMWHWPRTFWTNFIPVLIGMGLLTEDDQRAWHREWAELERTPGAFVLLPAVFDIIAIRR